MSNLQFYEKKQFSIDLNCFVFLNWDVGDIFTKVSDNFTKEDDIVTKVSDILIDEYDL